MIHRHLFQDKHVQETVTTVEIQVTGPIGALVPDSSGKVILGEIIVGVHLEYKKQEKKSSLVLVLLRNKIILASVVDKLDTTLRSAVSPLI